MMKHALLLSCAHAAECPVPNAACSTDTKLFECHSGYRLNLKDGDELDTWKMSRGGGLFEYKVKNQVTRRQYRMAKSKVCVGESQVEKDTEIKGRDTVVTVESNYDSENYEVQPFKLLLNEDELKTCLEGELERPRCSKGWKRPNKSYALVAGINPTVTCTRNNWTGEVRAVHKKSGFTASKNVCEPRKVTRWCRLQKSVGRFRKGVYCVRKLGKKLSKGAKTACDPKVMRCDEVKRVLNKRSSKTCEATKRKQVKEGRFGRRTNQWSLVKCLMK